VGYDILAREPGTSLSLATVWRTLAPLPEDLALFVHWLGPDGQILSQHDGFDASAQTIRPGDVVIQRHLLPWPAAASAGDSLQVGVYRRDTGTRMTTGEQTPAESYRLDLSPTGTVDGRMGHDKITGSAAEG
jgi:hypothetical protein